MWILEITKATRVTQYSATAIDNILCNVAEPATNCDASMICVSISCHSAVLCIFKHVAVSKNKSTIRKGGFCRL